MGASVSMKCGASVKIANRVSLSPIITKFSCECGWLCFFCSSASAGETTDLVGLLLLRRKARRAALRRPHRAVLARRSRRAEEEVGGVEEEAGPPL
jgi:hypothetical protein